jgi:hypothetical protein
VVEGLAAQIDSVEKVNGLYVSTVGILKVYLPFVIDIERMRLGVFEERGGLKGGSMAGEVVYELMYAGQAALVGITGHAQASLMISAYLSKGIEKKCLYDNYYFILLFYS